MNFRKRLFGYKKEEVNNYINQIENKYDNEKKEILSKIQNLNLEYNNLSEKNLLLSRNLRSIKENTAFIENNNAYFDKVVKNAKSEAIEQLESIKRSQKITFE